MAPDANVLAVAAEHLRAGKYFQVASFVILIFDHMLTFSEEVERIWKPKVSGATVLFLINRYVTPLQFIIILDVCELIMIFRVFALYGKSIPILIFLLILWTSQIAISSVGLATGSGEQAFPDPVRLSAENFLGTAVELPEGFTGCIFSGTSRIFPSLWVAPLITNTLMFGLTLYRTRGYLMQSGFAPTLHIFLRDGIIYFLVIFMANLTNTVIYFLAPPDLKAMGASFSQLITSTMVSRLVLNLRSSATPPTEEDTLPPRMSIQFHGRTHNTLRGGIEYEDRLYRGCDDIPMGKMHGA
ncbi:hypothetical protein FPV67DRAFT_1729865 [Lyophyllum atratum]|nr:hypothetical protein FPV67DRAFT_1729865 [Lyophyllum atratum]